MQRPKLLTTRVAAAAGGGGPYPAIAPLHISALSSFAASAAGGLTAASSSTHFGPFGYSKRDGLSHRHAFASRRPPTLPAINKQLFKLPEALTSVGHLKV